MNLLCAKSHSNASKLGAVLVKQCFCTQFRERRKRKRQKKRKKRKKEEERAKEEEERETHAGVLPVHTKTS